MRRLLVLSFIMSRHHKKTNSDIEFRELARLKYSVASEKKNFHSKQIEKEKHK